MAPARDDSDVRDRIRRYVEATFLPAHPNLKLRDDDGLLNKGIVDSIGVIELIGFLEVELGLEIGGDDMTEENLGSVAAITRFVIRKQALLQDKTA